MSDMKMAQCQRQDNEQFGADPLGLTAEQIERLYEMGCSKSLLWLMRATWYNHGFPAEPYSDIAALEIALNELIDEARERGCRVTWNDDEIGSPCGLCVHPPEKEKS